MLNFQKKLISFFFWTSTIFEGSARWKIFLRFDIILVQRLRIKNFFFIYFKGFFSKIFSKKKKKRNAGNHPYCSQKEIFTNLLKIFKCRKYSLKWEEDTKIGEKHTHPPFSLKKITVKNFSEKQISLNFLIFKKFQIDFFCSENKQQSFFWVKLTIFQFLYFSSLEKRNEDLEIFFNKIFLKKKTQQKSSRTKIILSFFLSLS